MCPDRALFDFFKRLFCFFDISMILFSSRSNLWRDCDVGHIPEPARPHDPMVGGLKLRVQRKGKSIFGFRTEAR